MTKPEKPQDYTCNTCKHAPTCKRAWTPEAKEPRCPMVDLAMAAAGLRDC